MPVSTPCSMWCSRLVNVKNSGGASGTIQRTSRPLPRAYPRRVCSISATPPPEAVELTFSTMRVPSASRSVSPSSSSSWMTPVAKDVSEQLRRQRRNGDRLQSHGRLPSRCRVSLPSPQTLTPAWTPRPIWRCVAAGSLVRRRGLLLGGDEGEPFTAVLGQRPGGHDQRRTGRVVDAVRADGSEHGATGAAAAVAADDEHGRHRWTRRRAPGRAGRG